MGVRNTWVALALLSAMVGLSAVEPDRIWFERDGLVAIECEDAGPHGWVVETAVPEYSGTGYIHHTGSGREIVYTVLIVTPGRYHIALRNFHDHPDSTLENDCFLAVDDGQPIKCFSGIKDRWNWASTMDEKSGKYPPIFTWQPGLHRVRISGRSTGFRIDQIQCYLEDSVKGGIDGFPASASSASLPVIADIPADSTFNSLYMNGAPGPLLAEAERRQATDPVAAQVVTACTAELQLRRAACERIQVTHPLGAAEALAVIAKTWSPSKAGKELMTEARAWSKTSAAKEEASTRCVVARVQPVAERLMSQGLRADDPKAAAFKRELVSILQVTRQLEASQPDGPYAQQARGWCDALGLPK